MILRVSIFFLRRSAAYRHRCMGRIRTVCIRYHRVTNGGSLIRWGRPVTVYGKVQSQAPANQTHEPEPYLSPSGRTRSPLPPSLLPFLLCFNLKPTCSFLDAHYLLPIALSCSSLSLSLSRSLASQHRRRSLLVAVVDRPTDRSYIHTCHTYLIGFNRLLDTHSETHQTPSCKRRVKYQPKTYRRSLHKPSLYHPVNSCRHIHPISVCYSPSSTRS
jgi:hypothetical protein